MAICICLLRHGEVEHHRADLALTARGRAQAQAAGCAAAGELAAGDSAFIAYSSLARTRETALELHAALAARLAQSGPAGVRLHAPEPDPALANVGFILQPDRPPQEPSVLYAETAVAAGQQGFAPAQASFYRAFWSSDDPMGYWLDHDSGGGAETVDAVLARLWARLAQIVAEAAPDGRQHWWLVTHSGALRALQRQVLGTDDNPAFCEALRLEQRAAGEALELSFRGRRARLDHAPIPGAAPSALSPVPRQAGGAG